MKWLFVSEYRRWGGGYTAIIEGLALGMNHAGEDIKVIGINYEYFQHSLPVSVIPLLSPEYLMLQAQETIKGWMPDVVVAMLDLPWHVDFYNSLQENTGFKYVGIFPVEGAPIHHTWADTIAAMDSAFTISQFGVKSCRESGVRVNYLPLACTPGIQTARAEDIVKMREYVKLNDRFAILKIADNHTRKNWAHTIEFFSKWHSKEDVLVAVTRPENQFGWDLGELCHRFGGHRVPNTFVWEWDDGAQIRILTGLQRQDIAWLLNVCDMMLIDSGNEGACLPIYEAFHSSMPVVGMDHTAITEVLQDGRGILFPSGYRYVDTYGNVDRFYPEYGTWREAIETVKFMPKQDRAEMVGKAKAWSEEHSWISSAQALLEGV